MALYNISTAAHRKILGKLMIAAHWHGTSIFSQMYGFQGGMDGDYPKSIPFGTSIKTIMPTFKPIEVLQDFNREGGVTMQVAVHYPLTEEAIYGDNTGKGTGEQKKFAYIDTIINQVTKAVRVSDGLMGDQALQNPDMIKKLLNNSKAELTEYHQNWQGYAPYDALLRGYSRNILASKADGGFGNTYSQASHPNTYVAGVGKATWSDTAATYETNVATALANLVDSDEFYFSTRSIETMIAYASQLRIRPAKIGNGQYYVIIINPMQALQLRNDLRWREAQNSLNVADKNLSDLFTGSMQGLYAGAFILVDINAPGASITGDTLADNGRAYDSTRGTVNYGNSNPIANPIDTAQRKAAILLGASAISCGQAGVLKFKYELDDFDRKKEDAAFTIIGYRRSDIYDTDGFFGTKDAFKENTSSLVYWTQSPSINV